MSKTSNCNIGQGGGQALRGRDECDCTQFALWTSSWLAFRVGESRWPARERRIASAVPNRMRDQRRKN